MCSFINVDCFPVLDLCVSPLISLLAELKMIHAADFDDPLSDSFPDTPVKTQMLLTSAAVGAFVNVFVLVMHLAFTWRKTSCSATSRRVWRVR